MYHNSTKFNFRMLLFSICWIPHFGVMPRASIFILFFHLLDSDIWFKIRQFHFIFIMLLFSIYWIPKYGSKFGKIENEYTKARGIFYDLSEFASGRCRKPGPEPTERRKQKTTLSH